MTKQEALAEFNDQVKPHVVARYGPDDKVALSEAWNNFTDMLQKDGQITAHQYDTWGNPIQMRRNPMAGGDLEAMIDQSSLSWVLDMLAVICSQKAEHIRENWQDYDLARRWEQASGICETAAGRKSVRDVSGK